MDTIVPVVEGEGEETAVPLLLRRLLHDASVFDVGVAKPVTAHGVGNLCARLGRFLRHASRRPECSAILVIHDSEGACPVEVAREHVARTREEGCARPVAFVVAHRMYESWLVASLPTVMPGVEAYEGDPEDLGDPKALMDSRMRPGRGYKETTDQAPMTAHLGPELARQCRSFRRLEAALDFLLDCIRAGKTGISPSP